MYDYDVDLQVKKSLADGESEALLMAFWVTRRKQNEIEQAGGSRTGECYTCGGVVEAEWSSGEMRKEH